MIQRSKLNLQIVLFSFLFFSVPIGLTAQSSVYEDWAYDSLHIPFVPSSNGLKPNAPIVIAVIDDGFRLTHQALKDFIYTNPKEIPNNQVDDDGNGYVDDVAGWDISDRDKVVEVVEGREKTFFHGTYIAGIITEVARRYYGVQAAQRIKILPVKVLSDFTEQTYVKDGYKGIQYAIQNGADIICMAWSGGQASEEELQILKSATRKGVLLIASSGNLNQEQVDYPAQSADVLAISGIDEQGQKLTKASYGIDVDLSAPASHVLGAHPQKDNAYILDHGTSPAAALVAGVAGVLAASLPNPDAKKIKEALLNSANPFQEKTFYSGKMGAGKIHMERALAYLSNPHPETSFHSPLRSKASLSIHRNNSQKDWRIAPPGDYRGFRLSSTMENIKRPEHQHLEIWVADTIWNHYALSQLPAQLFVPAQQLRLRLRQKKGFKRGASLKIHYRGEPIDSSSLYCSATRYLNEPQGTLEDGSGDGPYANRSSCKWLITAAPGQRIRITFEQMATEGNVDFIYLVDGKKVLKERIFAKFSGNTLPPVVTSRTNEVLLWFISDSKQVGDGWKLHWEILE